MTIAHDYRLVANRVVGCHGCWRVKYRNSMCVLCVLPTALSFMLFNFRNWLKKRKRMHTPYHHPRYTYRDLPRYFYFDFQLSGSVAPLPVNGFFFATCNIINRSRCLDVGTRQLRADLVSLRLHRCSIRSIVSREECCVQQTAPMSSITGIRNRPRRLHEK